MADKSCTKVDSDEMVNLQPGARRVSYSNVVTVNVYSLESLPKGIRKDLNKVALLIYLYMLQGIPLGNKRSNKITFLTDNRLIYI